MKKIILSVTLLLVTITLFPQKNLLLHFYAEAGQFDRINTPASLDLEGVIKSDTLSFILFEKVKGSLIEKACQEERGTTLRLWWIFDGTTPAGTKREYFLYSDKQIVPKAEVTTGISKDALILKKGGNEILQYRTSVLYPPKGVDTAYKRSGFVHPLSSPKGNIITRVSPPDHYQHFGIWNPWTVVKLDGHTTDFWNIGSKQGTVEFAGVNYSGGGPVFGGFSVKQNHIDFQGKRPKNPAINETWEIRAWNSEPLKGKSAFLIDFTSLISVPGPGKVVFEAYRYGGGIGIRATEEWNKDNSTVLTSEGKDRKEADGTRARWTDLNGAFQSGGSSGITFFSHPANREHPEPMRVWPLEQNGRGDVYFEFCPIRHKSWELSPDNIYRLKYRVLVYDGTITKEDADRVWNDFAFPPKISVVK